jgi:hypothetical protein
MEFLDDSIEFRVCGYSTSHYAQEKLRKSLDELEPFVIGAGSFDCESEGERWTEYVGAPEEQRKLESSFALLEVAGALRKLTSADMDALKTTLAHNSSDAVPDLLERLHASSPLFKGPDGNLYETRPGGALLIGKPA